jgi:hypothetical protein
LSERYVAYVPEAASVPLRGDSRFLSLTSSSASLHAASLPCITRRRAIAGYLTRSTAIIAVRRGPGSYVTSTLAWRIWRASVVAVSKPCPTFHRCLGALLVANLIQVLAEHPNRLWINSRSFVAEISINLRGPVVFAGHLRARFEIYLSPLPPLRHLERILGIQILQL